MEKIAGEKVAVWQKDGDSQVLAKKFGVELVVQNFTNPKSGVADVYAFASKKNGTTIVPITKEKKIVMVRQFKQGANAIVLEFPAGLLDWEKPMVKAREELESETGYVSSEVHTLGKTIFAPRKIQTEEHLFVALNCERKSEQRLDSGEVAIEIFELSQEEFWGMVKSGEIHSSATIVAATKALQKGYLEAQAFLASI